MRVAPDVLTFPPIPRPFCVLGSLRTSNRSPGGCPCFQPDIGGVAIARHPGPPPQVAETHRINERIRFPQIRVIAADGEQLGIMSPDEARSIAYEQGLDLVEVAPDARPPVCKIMDYGRHKYDDSKRKSASKSKEVKIKTIKLRPATDEHDLEFKLKNARAFLEEGNKVKFMMRLRGRENAVTERWIVKLVDVLAALNDIATPIGRPQGEGRMIVMMYEPK